MNQTKILVPIGFSDQSLKALEYSLTYAKKMNASLVLLSVMEESTLLGRIFKSSIDEDKVKKALHEKLEEIAKDIKEKNNIESEIVIAKGVVYEEIARVSELMEVDLVIMGTNGKPENFRRKFIGSNAYRTVTIVKPPVITLKDCPESMSVSKILFPLTADIKSKEKTNAIIKFARMFDAEVHVVGVAVVESEEQSLKASLRQIEGILSDAKVNHVTKYYSHKEVKSRVATLNAYTKDNQCDLIAISEEGIEPDVATLLLGTDVQEVIYNAEVPVLCITPKRELYGRILGS